MYKRQAFDTETSAGGAANEASRTSSGHSIVCITMTSPDDFTDSYRQALETVVASKLDGVEIPESEQSTSGGTNVVDLVAALRASVEAAKARRAEEEKKAKAG